MPAKERYDMAYARDRCWDMLFWVFDNYDSDVYLKETGEVIDGFKDVAMPYLVQLGSNIIVFKKMAKDSQMNDDEETFTIKDLTRQVRVKLCFKLYLEVPKLEEAEDVNS